MGSSIGMLTVLVAGVDGIGRGVPPMRLSVDAALEDDDK